MSRLRGTPLLLLIFTLHCLTSACTASGMPLLHSEAEPAENIAIDDLAAIAQPPARNPIQDEILYFVLPDRFANGSTANDSGGLEGDRLVTGYDPSDKGFYHGGDIAGLISKLDYLEQLGITAIWMTPLFKNKTVQGPSDAASAAYHGYWIVDFTQLDPHFGANQELEELIDQAHERGIKIFFDIITNHTADVIQTEEGQTSYRSKAEYPYRDANGVPFDDKDYVDSNSFPTLSATQSFPYTPVIPDDELHIKVPPWLNAPIYYHNRGNSQFSGENSLYGDFAGLDDLFTEHPKVVEGMIDIYNSWISNYDIDGFRVDTVKHVDAAFWRDFCDAVLAHAKAVGKDEFFIFGEVYSGNENLLSYYTTDSDMPGVLDFGLQGNTREYISRGASASNLSGFFAYDDIYIDEDSNAYSLPTFTGNHDMGRFGYFLHEDHGTTLSDDELLQRDKLAHALLFFARGVPVIYYGDEQGFTGDGGDQGARQDLFGSQVESYNDDDLIGTDATTAQDNFDTSHPLYQAISQYAALRKAHVALHSGAQIERFAADGSGIYAFSRIDRDEDVEFIVAFNNGTAASAQVQSYYGSDVPFTLLYAEGDTTPPTVAQALTTDSEGRLDIHVPALGFVIYQAGSALPASAAAPAIAFSTLTSNQEVARAFQEVDGNQLPERIELGVSLGTTATASQDATQPLNQPVEVTFAVRASGTSTSTLIGVDDNPPYRVFYDASSWPDETQLDFIAVVNDLNGHFNSALVENIMPVYTRPAKPDAEASTYPCAVVHYLRSDQDYGDATSDSSDAWGLHVWGNGLASGEATDWSAPKPFLGEDDYGRFAWVKLSDATQDIGFIVHKGESKDGTDADRFFNPLNDGPEIWLKQGDATIYTSQAAAQGHVTIHYQRPDGDYEGWGLHLWGEGINETVATTWESACQSDGEDDFGLFWTVPISDVTQSLNFIIHRGEEKDPGPDQMLIPQANAAVWIKSGDEMLYPQLCAATNMATLHYRRPADDYGDVASDDFADFWGLHTWNAAEDPGWQTPYRPVASDPFGIIFQLEVDSNLELGYIFHKGDEKDPGPDQFLNFERWGCEVWQMQDAEVEAPYLLPVPARP